MGKKILILIGIILLTTLLFGCLQPAEPEKKIKVIDGVEYLVDSSGNIIPSDRNLPIVGNDIDEYGCIPSAGYTWCEVKNKCIRIWEEECNISNDLNENLPYDLNTPYDLNIPSDLNDS